MLENYIADLKKVFRLPDHQLPLELVNDLKINIPENYWPNQKPPVTELNWSTLPFIWPLPSDKELIQFGYNTKRIKPHFASITNRATYRDPRNDFKYLYLHHTGSYRGAYTKEDAEKEWLVSAKQMIPRLHQQHEYIESQRKAVSLFKENLSPLRKDLYEGKIKAFLFNENDGVAYVVKPNYWLMDACLDVFNFLKTWRGTGKIAPKFLDLPYLGSYSTQPQQFVGTFLFTRVDNQVSKRIKRGAGRKKGDGKYPDEIYLAEMKELIETRKAKSRLEAARIVVGKHGEAILGPSTEQKIKRLRENYSKNYNN